MFFLNRYLSNLNLLNNRNGNVKAINKKNNLKRRVVPFFRKTNNLLVYRLINKELAKNLIEMGQVFLIDVRTKEEFDKIHIKNAVNIPLEDLKNTMLTNNLDKNINIVPYCATGTRSKMAIKILNDLGYKNVNIWEYAALTTFPYKELIIRG